MARFSVSRSTGIFSKIRKATLMAAAVAAAGIALAPQQSDAAIIQWSPTNAATGWNTAANWLNQIAPADNTTVDTALFNSTSYANQPSLTTDRSIRGVQFGDGATNTAAVTLSGAFTLITGGAGITVSANAGAVTFNSNVRTNDIGTYANNSTSLLTFAGTLNSATNNNQLILGGSGTGNININGSMTTGTQQLIFAKTAGQVNVNSTVSIGAGGLALNAGSTAVSITGNTTINGAQTWWNNSTSTLTDSGTITVGNNAWGFYGTGSGGFNFTNTVTGGTGLLTVANAGGVTIGNTYTQGTAGVQVANNSGGLTVNASVVLSGTQTWNNHSSIAVSGGVSGATFGLTVAGSGNTSIGGAITTTTGTLTKNGAGTLTLNSAAVNTFTGLITINGGQISADYGNLATPTNLFNANALTLGGGKLNLTAKNNAATAQTLGNVSLTSNQGANTIQLNNVGTSSFNLTLGTITVTVGSALNLVPAATGSYTITTTTASAADGTYGSRLVWGSGTGADWVGSTGGPTFTLQAYGAYTPFVTSGGVSTTNYSLSGSSASTGTQTINSLKIATTGAGQSLALSTFNLTLNNGGLLFTGADNYTISGTTGTLNATGEYNFQTFGTGSLTVSANLTSTLPLGKYGPGTLILTGANTYNGVITVGGGVLSANATTNLGTGTNAIQLMGGTFQAGGTFSTSRTWTMGSGGGTIDTQGNTLTMAGIASGTGTLTKIGSGTLIITAAATYSGGLTFLKEGTIQTGVSTALPAATTVVMGTSTTNATLKLNNALTVSGLQVGTGATAASQIIQADTNATLTFTGAASTNSAFSNFGGTLQNGSATLSVAVNSGTLSLSGNNTYSGNTTIGGATLNINSATAFGSGTLLTSSNSAVIDNTSGSAVTLTNNNNFGTSAAPVTNFWAFGGTNSLNFGSGGFYTGPAFNNPQIRMNGQTTSTLTFGGSYTNGYTGGVTQTLDIIGGNHLVTFGGIVLSTDATNRTLQIQSTGNVTVTGAIVNGGTATASNLSFTGSGTYTLSGSSSYAGITTVNNAAAILDFNSIGNVGGGNSALGAPTTVAAGTIALSGTLRYSGAAASTNRVINMTGAGTILNVGTGLLTLNGNISGNQTTTFGGTADITTTGVLTVGQIIKRDSNTVLLSGAAANTVSSTITVLGGTLRLATASQINSGQQITVRAGTMDLNGQQNYTGSQLNIGGGASGTATFATGTSIWTSNGAGTAINYDATNSIAAFVSGNISHDNTTHPYVINDGTNLIDVTVSAVIAGGSAAISKRNAGAMELQGLNTYTGATVIRDGALVAGNNAPVSAAGAFGNASSTINIGDATAGTNPALYINGNYTVSRNVQTIATANSWSIGGISANTSTFAGALTLATPITISQTTGGTVQFTGGISGGTQNITTSGAGNINLASTISGSTGTLNVNGTGVVTLSAASARTGLTTVNGGTFRITSPGSVAGAVTVNSSATLAGTGSIAGALTVNTGGKIAPGASIGTLSAGTTSFATGTVLDYEFGTPTLNPATSLSDLLAVTGDLSFTVGAGTITLNLLDNANNNAQGSIGAGVYKIMTYTGTLNNFTLSEGTVGGMTGTFAINTSPLPSNYYYKVTSTGGSNGEIDLTILAPYLSWTGQINGIDGNPDSSWNNGTSTNFASGAAPTGATAVGFATSDAVTFGDTNRVGAGSAITNNNVAVQAGGVTPGVVTFENASVNYTFTSDDSVGIAGSAGIYKVGAAMVTLAGPNTFTSTVSISAGSIRITHADALGSSAGVAVTGTGELQLDGVSPSSAIPLSVAGAGNGGTGGALHNISGANTYSGAITATGAATIKVDAGSLSLAGGLNTGANTVTLNGAGTTNIGTGLTGTGGVTYSGSGTLNLSGTHTGFLGVATLSSGTVNVAAGTTLGDSGAGSAGAKLILNGASLRLDDGTIGAFNVTQQASFAPATTALTLNGANITFDLNSATTTFDSIAINVGKASVTGTNNIDLSIIGTSALTFGTYNLITVGAGGGLSGTFVHQSNGLSTKNITLGANTYGLILASTGSALTLTIGNSLAIWDGDATPGDYSWSAAPTNWVGNNAPSVNDTLVFAGTVGTTSPNNDFAPNTNFTGITFDSSASSTFTITGNAINLTGNVINSSSTTHVVNIDLALQQNTTLSTSTGALTINGVISGGFGVTVAGTAAVTLTNTNTFSGGLAVTTGKLAVASVNNASTNGVFGNNTGITLGGTSQTGTLDYTAAADATTDMPIALATGGTGVIQVDSAANKLTLTGNITGNGALKKTGAGKLDLTGANSYAGGTEISAGTLSFASGSIGTGAIKFTGGVLQYDAGNTDDISTTPTIAGSTSSIRLDTNGNNVTFATAIDNTNTGGLTKLGAGKLSLTVANAYTGGTIINAGTIAQSADNALGTTGNINFTGGTLQYVGNAQDLASRITNSTSAISIDVNGNTVTYAGAINNTNTGGLTVSDTLGTGKLIITSTTSAFTGGITINSGATLQWGTAAGTTNPALPGNIVNNGTLILAHGVNAAGNFTYTGTISGSGSLVVAGANGGNDQGVKFIMRNTGSSYTGGTFFNSGLLSVEATSDAILGQAPVTAAVNLTFNGGGFGTWNSNGTAVNPLVLGPTRTILINSGGAFLRNGWGISMTIQGQITGTGGLNVVYDGGAGVVTLQNSVGSGGANDYQGDTTIGSIFPDYYGLNNPSATLRMGDVNQIPYGAGKGNVVFGAQGALISVLNLNNFNTRINGLSGGSTGRVTSAGAATLTVGDNDQTSTFSGGIQGATSIYKVGTGTLTLGGGATLNTYTGSTTINGGTLALDATGTFANSPTITVGDTGSSGTVLDLTAKASFSFGTGQTVKGIGTVNIGAGKLVTFNGGLQPGNSVGTLSLTGDATLASTAITTMEIDGNASLNTYDVFAVSGALTYGGTLTVPAFLTTPTAVGIYTLFTFASQSGDFTAVNLPAAPLGMQWHDYGVSDYFDNATGQIQLESGITPANLVLTPANGTGRTVGQTVQIANTANLVTSDSLTVSALNITGNYNGSFTAAGISNGTIGSGSSQTGTIALTGTTNRLNGAKVVGSLNFNVAGTTVPATGDPSGAQSYPLTGSVSGNTVAVAGNGTTFGTAQTALVVSGDTLAGLSTTESDSAGSTLTLVDSTAVGADSTVTVRWRERSVLEAYPTGATPPLPVDIKGLISDVAEVTMTAAPSVYVVQMSYDDSSIGNGINEVNLFNQGQLYLAHMADLATRTLQAGADGINGSSDDEWANATLDTSNPQSAGYLRGYLAGDLSLVGSWGVDTVNNVAWAVVDGTVQGQFAVVPEPASLGLLALGALGLMTRRRR